MTFVLSAVLDGLNVFPIVALGQPLCDEHQWTKRRHTLVAQSVVYQLLLYKAAIVGVHFLFWAIFELIVDFLVIVYLRVSNRVVNMTEVPTPGAGISFKE